MDNPYKKKPPSVGVCAPSTWDLITMYGLNEDRNRILRIWKGYFATQEPPVLHDMSETAGASCTTIVSTSGVDYTMV